MGEYFIICNIDRKEVLDPGVFGHGYKPGDLLFNATSKGVLHGLLHLLSLSGSVGGVQRRETDPLFGRWAGNRIALIGDYYEGPVAGILWSQDYHVDIRNSQDGWVDISEHVVHAIGGDLDNQSDLPRSVLYPNGTVQALPYPWGQSEAEAGTFKEEEKP